jgi:hypothetical protein
VQFTRFKNYGIHVTNCEGTPANQIDLSGLTFTTTAADQIGLYFDIEKHSIGTIPKDRYFRIRECKFNGPGEKGKLSPTAEVDYIDVQKDLSQLAPRK